MTSPHMPPRRGREPKTPRQTHTDGPRSDEQYARALYDAAGAHIAEKRRLRNLAESHAHEADRLAESRAGLTPRTTRPLLAQPRTNGAGMTVVTAQMGLTARDNLTWIADQWPRLRAALDPTRGNAHTGMPRAPEAHPAPINLHISDLMHEIENETRMLAHVLLDETDDWQPTTSSMPGLLYDVAQRYGHWTASDTTTALAFLDWAEDYQHRVHRALTKPAPPTYIGPCRVRECEGELYLRPGRASTTCPECGHETDAAEQVEWIGEQFEQRLMTPTELASALKVLGDPVPMGTIKSWISRERLPEVTDGLYRVSDAQKLALARKTRGKVSA